MDENYLERMNRQLPLWGIDGQGTIYKSKLCVVGSGRSGSLSGIASALVGFGDIKNVDADSLERSNLNGAFLWGHGNQTNLGESKAEIVKGTINDIDPNIKASAVVNWIESYEGLKALCDSDVVVLCVDQNEPRIIVNGYCARLGKPVVDIGSGIQLDENGKLQGLGWRVSFFRPGGPCLRCIYLDDEPMPQAQASYLPLNLSAVGTAMDLLVAYVSDFKPIRFNHIVYDGMTGRFDQMLIESRPDCPLCGEGRKG